MATINCTLRSRIELTKELRRNNVPFEFGRNLEQVILDIENPKAKIAIRMTKERIGLQSIAINN